VSVTYLSSGPMAAECSSERGAVVRDEPARQLSFASYLIRLRLVPEALVLNWMSLLWDSSHVRRWIEARAATSAGQYNISLGVLETLSVPLPSLADKGQSSKPSKTSSPSSSTRIRP